MSFKNRPLNRSFSWRGVIDLRANWMIDGFLLHQAIRQRGNSHDPDRLYTSQPHDPMIVFPSSNTVFNAFKRKCVCYLVKHVFIPVLPEIFEAGRITLITFQLMVATYTNYHKDEMI